MKTNEYRMTREERKQYRKLRAIWKAVIVIWILCLIAALIFYKPAEPENDSLLVQDEEVKEEIAEVVEPTVEEEPDPLEDAITIGECRITHYCICEKCCHKTPDHPAYGITASGVRAKPYYSVAVDPNVIPLGSEVMIDYGDGEIYYYRADDTGKSIKGNRIDVCVEDHQTGLNLGVKTGTVYYKMKG